MSRKDSRSRRYPRDITRGPKTHRADILLNRGVRRAPEPRPEDRRDAAADEATRVQEQVREEHPTRKTQAGYLSRHGHRR